MLRERAVRLILEHRADYPSTAKAIAAVARQGVGAESLLRSAVQADMDAGNRDGLTGRPAKRRLIKRLEASLDSVDR